VVRRVGLDSVKGLTARAFDTDEDATEGFK